MNLSEAERTPITVLLSTGLGRLHLVQSASALLDRGVRVNLLQGWVPRRIPKFLVRALGKIVRSPDLSASLEKRRVTDLEPSALMTLPSAEFISQALLLASKFTPLSYDTARTCGWKEFGRQSKKYILDQDIFHVRSGAGGDAILQAKKYGIPVLVDHSIVHPQFMRDQLASEYEIHSTPFSFDPDSKFWKHVLSDCSAADHLLVNSDLVKRTFVDRGYPKNRISVVYQGIRQDFHGLKKDYKVKSTAEILYTGTFGIRKGGSYLLQASDLLTKRGVRHRISIVGNYGESVNLKGMALGNSNIRLLGHRPQDELAAFLSNSDLYVFPSLAEGCASSLIEAMGAGLPCIATVESGAPLQHEANAMVVPAKDAVALADQIQALLENDELRVCLGNSAKQSIAELCSWENYAKQLCAVYGNMLKR